MKFDIFSRKKFKYTICDEKFKTQPELTEHKHMRHGGNNLTIGHNHKPTGIVPARNLDNESYKEVTVS